MKIILFLALIILIIVTIFFIKFRSNRSNNITIKDTTITVEIADTNTKRQQGLSDRESLPENTGLLFIFPTSDIHSFWNYHMKFPIDVLWIDDGIIKEIGNLPIDAGRPVTYTPKEKASYVLEVNQGVVKKYQWKLGDQVIIRLR